MRGGPAVVNRPPGLGLDQLTKDMEQLSSVSSPTSNASDYDNENNSGHGNIIKSGGDTNTIMLKRCKSLTWAECTWNSDILSNVRKEAAESGTGNTPEISSSLIDLFVSQPEDQQTHLDDMCQPHHSPTHDSDYGSISEEEAANRKLYRRATFAAFPKNLSGVVIRGGPDHIKLRDSAGVYERPPEWTGFNEEYDTSSSSSTTIDHNNNGHGKNKMLRRCNSTELVRRAFPEMLFDRVSPNEGDEDAVHEFSLLSPFHSEESSTVGDDDEPLPLGPGLDVFTPTNNGGSSNGGFNLSAPPKTPESSGFDSSSSHHEHTSRSPVHTTNEINNDDGSRPPPIMTTSANAAMQQQHHHPHVYHHHPQQQFMYYMPVMGGQPILAPANMSPTMVYGQPAMPPPGAPPPPPTSMHHHPAMYHPHQMGGMYHHHHHHHHHSSSSSASGNGFEQPQPQNLSPLMQPQQQQQQQGHRTRSRSKSPVPNASSYMPMRRGSNDSSSSSSCSSSGASVGAPTNAWQNGSIPGVNSNNNNNGSSSPVPPVCSTLLAEHKHAGRKPTVQELCGHVLEFSKDSHGSRYLQEIMASATKEDKQILINEVMNDCLSIMQDLFGNYVVQVFLDHATNEQRDFIANRMRGVLVSLSMHPHGCRVVQRALDVIGPQVRCELLKELVSTSEKLEIIATDGHATHVLQKAVVVMQRDVYPHLEKRAGRGDKHKKKGHQRGHQNHIRDEKPDAEALATSKRLLKAVEDVVAANVMTLAVNAHSCRLVQRVLGDCNRNRSPCVSIMMDALEADYENLSVDQHGNFILQHILELGQQDQADRIQDYVSTRAGELSQHKFGSHLVEKCLVTGSPKQVHVIVAALLASPYNVLTKMMKDPYANFVLQRAIDVSGLEQRAQIQDAVNQRAEVLANYNHGRHMLAAIKKKIEAK